MITTLWEHVISKGFMYKQFVMYYILLHTTAWYIGSFEGKYFVNELSYALAIII